MNFVAYAEVLAARLKLWLGQQCVNCEQASLKPLCVQCNGALTPIGVHCQSCAREVAHAHTICGACLQTPHAIDKMYVAYRYRSPLREIVLKAKYGHDRGALDVLQQLILVAWPTGLTADWIVPMPISKQRLAWRGFNQTHVLAKILSIHANIPMYKQILRKQTRAPQSVLTNDATRRANIKGAFSADADLSGHVVLVDDVYTSGATAKEAAAVLKAAGVAQVSFICVAAR